MFEIHLFVGLASFFFTLSLFALVCHIIDRFKAPLRVTFVLNSGGKIKVNLKELSIGGGAKASWESKEHWREMLGYLQADELAAVRVQDRRRTFCP